ncbi:hypothetical protein [Streptomyces sp. NEAU-L66]|uniref:hypothetical protein n=1 Tax=Streptomyces sp. NEAU-L66 TaxID=3390812 RepID=UPI0039C61E63
MSEARDDKGTFYPLVERAAAWSDCSPRQVLRQLRTDLLAHTNGRLGDDAAAVAVRRLGGGPGGGVPAPPSRPGSRHSCSTSHPSGRPPCSRRSHCRTSTWSRRLR